MSSSSATALLLSASALLLATSSALSVGGGSINGAELREIGWELSTAFQRVVSFNKTTQAVFSHSTPHRDGYYITTDKGDFTLNRAFTRLALTPDRTRDQMHEGCTYRMSHHGPRSEYSPGDGWGSSVVSPNITSVRHVPTTDCPTNTGPSYSAQQHYHAEFNWRNLRF